MKVSKRKPILAWHFLPADRLTRWGDRSKPVVAGSVLHVEPPLNLCSRGLHASVRAIDALNYAPGPVVCRVKLWGEVVNGNDKLCAEYREVVAMDDASEVLWEFACSVAEQALEAERKRGREPDARSWAAIEARRKWLRKEIDDEQLAAASDAAWAASDAAWAARAAARAAWAAARAARAAAWDARAAAWDDQEAQLLERFAKLLGLRERRKGTKV